MKGGLGQGIEMEMTERRPSEPSESLKAAFCFPSPLPRVQAEAFSLGCVQPALLSPLTMSVHLWVMNLHSICRELEKKNKN